MEVKLGREFDKDEKSFIDYHKDTLERGDLKEIQGLINSGMTGRSVLLLWAYITNNLTIHTESLPDGIQMVTLALKSYTGGNDDFPFIESDWDDVKYWLAHDLKLGNGLIKDILGKAIKV